MTPLSVTSVTSAPTLIRCAPTALASAFGIWSMPPTGWNISIAWS